MTNVVPFEAGGPPAIFSSRRSTLNQAASQGVQASFAVIGYKGRNWRIKYRGDEQLLMGGDGRTPLPNLDVVVVGVSPAISKQYYEKRFVEGSDEPPDCFSVDGISPDQSSPKKQCATCAICPKNAWGSRVSDEGKKGKACQDSRRVAVVPLGDIENETYGGPMMLRIPPMSLNNLANYAQLLERKGASLEFVGTRLGFDYDVAYPRITFEPIGWLSNEQAAVVVGQDGQSGVCADPLIDRMLQEGPTDNAATAEADPLANGAPAAVMAQRVAAQPSQQVAEQAAQAVAQPVQQPQPAPAQEQPPKRQRAASAFQTAAPVTQTVQVASAHPQPQAAPQVQAPLPPTIVAEAPSDMLSAIDELLAAPLIA